MLETGAAGARLHGVSRRHRADRAAGAGDGRSRRDGYVGTPSFLKIILDKADELGVALPSLTKALVSGEAFPASLRDALAARGIDGYQVYATADLGSSRTNRRRAKG